LRRNQKSIAGDQVTQRQFRNEPDTDNCLRYFPETSSSLCTDAFLNKYCNSGTSSRTTQWPPRISTDPNISANETFSQSFNL